MKFEKVRGEDSKTTMALVRDNFGDSAFVISNFRNEEQNEIIVAVDNGSHLSIADHAPAVDHSFQTKDKVPLTNTDKNRATENLDFLLKELNAFRDEMKNIAHRRPDNSLKHQSDLGLIPDENYETLLDAGLTRQTSQSFLSNTKKKADNRQVHMDLDSLPKSLASWVNERLFSDNQKISDNEVITLVGNPGSGKTSMLARIATILINQRKEERILLLSFRDQRLGAWNTHRMIGERLGLHCCRISDANELEKFATKRRENDKIIIDTSSTNLSEDIGAIKNVFREVALYPVIAGDATESSAKRLLDIIKHETQTRSTLITRLDGERHPWQVLCAILESNFSVALGSMGNNPFDTRQSIFGHSLPSYINNLTSSSLT